MSEMLLINPRARRGKNGRFMKTAKTTPRKTTRRRRRTRTASATVAKATRRIRRRASVAVGKIRRRRSSGGGAGGGGILKSQVIPGVIGGVGLVAVEALQARLTMLPPALSTGMGRTVTKAALGVGVGMLVSKLLKKPALGTAIASVTIASATRDMIVSQAGGVLGLTAPAGATMQEYVPGLGEYVGPGNYPNVPGGFTF